MNARLLLAAAACTAISIAQGAAPEPAPTANPAPSPPATAPKPTNPPESLPDLDSLLGTKSDKKPDPTKPEAKPGADDPSRKELDRQLSPKEQADEFAKAVELMDETADRVEKQKDTGLATQRLQEDILTRLDRLIKAAQKNQSSKSQSQQDQDKDKDKNKNMKQQSQAQSQQAAKTTDPQQGTDGPARLEGELGTPPAAPPASWGDLPAHVREALLQGFSDKFSSMYQSLTESYYRKLAEEKKK